jgi:hypothetical protein
MRRLANQGWRQMKKKIELLNAKSMGISHNFCYRIDFYYDRAARPLAGKRTFHLG